MILLTRHPKAMTRKKTDIKENNHLTLSEHLSELRSRIVIVALYFLLFAVVSYLLSDTIIIILIAPLHDNLVFTTPSGGFDFKINISIISAFLCVLPVIAYQLLQFISPILPKNIIHKIVIFALTSLFLSIVGLIIAYYIFLPATLTFFKQFIGPQMTQLIVAQEYLRFVAHYLIGFALLFQLPLVLIIINSIHTLTFNTLMQYQRYVLLGSFIIAAFLTPTPDIMNQIAVAIPIILLYEISILIIVAINHYDILQLKKFNVKK